MALARNGTSDFLYATNFRSGNIDVFDHTFKPVNLSTDAVPLLKGGAEPGRA